MTDFDLIFTHLHVLEPYMFDKSVSEINVNWDGGVYVERLGECRRAPVVINQLDYQHGVQLIAHAVKGESLDPRNPRFNGSLLDGSRVAILVPPASHKGITLSIRKHRDTSFTVD